MKLKRRVISVLMVLALVLTSIPMTLLPGSVTASAAPAEASLVLNRPTAGIYVNEVTRVAYSSNSMKPPSGENSVIVKATKSGIPYLTGTYAPMAYVGETPYATQISFTPGVTLPEAPTISCSNTTVTYASETPAYANGTYTWTVSGGTAVVGSVLIFTVSYSYSETNAVSGKTYTNRYETQCVSYVESIATPAGMYTSKRTYQSYGLGSDTKNRSYVAEMVLGENTYGTVHNGGSGDGSIDFNNNDAFNTSTAAWTTDYGVMKRFDGTSTSRNYNVSFKADANRPLSITYIDKSVTSTLSSLNLRIHSFNVRQASNSNERCKLKITDSFIVSGIVDTFEASDTENNPTNDATATSELGYVSTDKEVGLSTTLDSTIQCYFEGLGPCKSIGTKEYTVSIRFNTPADWTKVYLGQSVSLRFITYDKGSLRTLLEDIHGTDPTTMSVNLASGEFKGYNPQSWYYSSGWEDFHNAYIAAKRILAKPDVSQSDIDTAYADLQTAYANLEMRKADYTLAEAYYKQAIAKNQSDYTLASWAKLQNLLDSYEDDCSVLYQPAIDKIAEDIKNAIATLEYTTADYSEFNANLNTVNKLISEAPTIYNRTAAEVWDGWSKLVNVLNNSGCVYNELEGYAVGTYLDITQQATVDGYTLLLRNAIDSLKLNSADYSTAKIAESAYNLLDLSLVVDEIATEIQAAYNAMIALYNLDISHQPDIDKAVATLNYWLDNVEYKPADTTAAVTIIATANALDRSQYADMTAVDNAVSALEAKMGLDIRYQSEIDRAVEAVRTAIAALKPNSADYTEVDKAIAEADAVAKKIRDTYASTYGFTAAQFYSNWSEVTKAINNVVRNLDSSKQATVDSYAAAIRSALSNLSESKADYSAVTAAQQSASTILSTGNSLYTSESLNKLTEAYVAVVPNLNISKQAEVDAFAEAITDAISTLEYLPANYGDVTVAQNAASVKLAENAAYTEAHPGYTLFTTASLEKLNTALSNVDTTLDIRYQTTVNGFATAINEAVNSMEYAPADYTQVEIAKSKIPTDLTVYTNLSVATLNSVLNKIDTTLTADQQSVVDNYAANIETAVKGLKYKKADYGKVTAAKKKVPTDSSLYTEASWQNLQDKLNAVVENLDASYQSQVDGYAAAIEAAIESLEYKPADYTKVNDAIKAVENLGDLSGYTAESVKALEDAISAVVENLDIRYQEQVDAYADEITAKKNALAAKGADYTELTEAVNTARQEISDGWYTEETVAALNAVIESINWNLPLSEQTTVDGYKRALDAVVRNYAPADYTELNKVVAEAEAKIATGWYTDESCAKVRAEIDKIVYNKQYRYQSEVDKYTSDIVKANNEMTKKLANYTELQKILDLLDNSSSEIYNNTYKNFDEVMALINSYRTTTVEKNMSLTIDQQSTVDEMTETLQGYLDSLELATEIFEAKEGSTTVIKGGYIYGLKNKMKKSDFQNSFITYDNVTLSYSGNTGRYLGTGTVVTVTSDITKDVIATYTIVIYGDIDGDGDFNAGDGISMSNILLGGTATAAQKKAANLNGDRVINANDYNMFMDVLQGYATINQVTGKCS